MANFLDLILGLKVEASRPALWGALALFVFSSAVVLGMGWKSKLAMTRKQRISLLIMRVAVLMLLAAALAGFTGTEFRQALSVTILADTSQSIPADQVDRVKTWIETAWAKKGDVPVRVLNFDRFAKESLPTGNAPEVRPVSDRPGTDIARAIHAGQGAFEKNSFHRLVLLSDGNETMGDALFESGKAKAAGVRIDVVPLNTRSDRDIYIESLNLPKAARPGEKINVAVTVVSNFATTATLRLKRGKTIEISKKIDVTPGSQTIDFETKVKTDYSTNYTADIAADSDDHPDNNALSAMLRVSGNPRTILFSGNKAGDSQLLEALAAGKLSVKGANIDQFPSTANGLSPYDLVVLSNVDFLKFEKQKAEALSKYLADQGGGLMIVGGENTSTLRKDKDKKEKTRTKLPIEDLMPVFFKEKKKTEPNPVALLLVIDKSASMARQNKFGMAMRAAKDTIELLKDRDSVGVILFDDFPRWAIPLQLAKDKDAILEKLDQYGVDGGTSIYPAIKEARTAFKPLPNKVKHVILLSDGQSMSTFDQNAHVLQEMADKKITISTVALGKESDKEHLRKIAQIGRGRFYYTEDINQIPKIFIEETKSITKTNVVETEFEPEVVKKGEMLKGVDLKSLPHLFGYNSARGKPTAEVYLLSENKEPLLARWRYGLGRVTFFGSDSGSDWARGWVSWSEYEKFWGRVASHTLGDKNRRTYRLETKIEDDAVNVTVDALDVNGDFLNDLALDLEINRPDGEKSLTPLTQVRPGGYSGRFALSEFGEYSFTVGGKDAGAAGTEGVGRIFLSPPTEFISQATNTALLKKIANVTTGRYDPTVEQVFQMPPQKFPVDKPLWPYLLYGALGLFIVSVLVRRS